MKEEMPRNLVLDLPLSVCVPLGKSIPLSVGERRVVAVWGAQTSLSINLFPTLVFLEAPSFLSFSKGRHLQALKCVHC